MSPLKRVLLRTMPELTGELADQRLCLAEECERLASAQECWQRDHAEALAELEAAGLNLREREQALQAHEKAGTAQRQRSRNSGLQRVARNGERCR